MTEQQPSRVLHFAYNNKLIQLHVPADIVENRGQSMRATPSQRIAISAGIETEIKKYFRASAKYRDLKLKSFYHDVMLLWHYGDPRIQLLP